ncbi:hypothetical protein Tco_0732871 [Tanacetum coccineum]
MQSALLTGIFVPFQDNDTSQSKQNLQSSSMTFIQDLDYTKFNPSSCILPNGSVTSKDNEDPSWSTSFKTQENFEDIFSFGKALEDFIYVVFVQDRNITTTSNALISCDGSGYDWSDQVEEGLGYNVVPPPYTRNFMPLKPALSLSSLEEFVNEPIVSEPTVKKLVAETSEAKASADKPKVVRKNNGAPIIEEWVSDSEDEAESKPKIE